jgi:hypothetical protein
MKKRWQEIPRCEAPGCEGRKPGVAHPVYADGLCWKHFQGPRCKMDHCERPGSAWKPGAPEPVYKDGLCHSHYQSKMSSGMTGRA